MTREQFHSFFEDWILKAEGGYVNHPHDPGGETKYGISKRAYPSLDIKRLTTEQAEQIYWYDYWNRQKCYLWHSEVIGMLMCDMYINHGRTHANKILQRAINNVLIQENEPIISVDGILGAITEERGNYVDGIYGLMYELLLERVAFYTRLSKFNIFGKGWISHRIIKLKKYLTRR